MKNSITAILIDPKKYERNYPKELMIYSYAGISNFQSMAIELIVEKDATNILCTLYDNKEIDCIITLCEQDSFDFTPMNDLSFEYRKKWIHIDDDEYEHFADADYINLKDAIINVYFGNLDRSVSGADKPLFSFFTSAYKTSIKQLDRLYDSLKKQTYKEWNWFVMDDSPDGELRVMRHLKSYKDPRIKVFKNVTEHGNIGKNKHNIAMLCNGDWLFEIDHDDEILPYCLEELVNAIKEFPDTDFLYSHAIEIEPNGYHIKYGKPFAYGTGQYLKKWIHNGTEYYDVPLTGDINAATIRGIHACPNHLRCWKKEFYHKINGHNTDFCVIDDLELIIRTFLYGKMTKVDDILYIQYASSGNRVDSRTGSATIQRFGVIQSTNSLIRHAYDKRIHNRLLELCGEDYMWDEATNKSKLYIEEQYLEYLKPVCNIYDPKNPAFVKY